MDIEHLKACLDQYHLESYGWARFCCRGDADEADNILQTVYLKILEQRAVFNGNAAFRTWLFGVIRVTAADFRRRRVLQRLQLVRFHALQQQPSRPVRADEALDRAGIQTEFRRALAALPRRQAEILQLVMYHDLSVAEAAEAIGVSVGSARTHYDRGKKNLRILLERAGWK